MYATGETASALAKSYGISRASVLNVVDLSAATVQRKNNVELKLPEPDFLTFAELARKLGCPAAKIHDLIRNGQIVPAIFLTDRERYVGGVFYGGSCVGDIDGATHTSYNEYYIGTNPDEDNYFENWPQCRRTMYCHCPEDDAHGGYSFQFLSESPNFGDPIKWFYLDKGEQIRSIDGERRFRFVWSHTLARYKDESAIDQMAIESVPVTKNGTAAVSTSDALSALDVQASLPAPKSSSTTRTVRHTTRVHVLGAEIKEAKKKATNPDDVHSIWAELVKMAEAEVGCFLGVVEGKLKYRKSNGEADYFTMKKLRNRLRDRALRASNIASPRIRQ